jgi:hypothetical protein
VAVIDPQYFGCSAKLSLCETTSLAYQSGRATILDYSTISKAANTFSIDRINRCSKDWSTFADIALNHALGDIEVGSAAALTALLAFEFGPETSIEDRAAASIAFHQSLKSRFIEAGKCHSGFGLGPTAVTIAVAGTAIPRAPVALSSGSVYISRRLGFFKAHYLHEMGVVIDKTFSDELRRPRRPFDAGAAVHSDISGHGLAGALLGVALNHNIDVTVKLSEELAASPYVSSIAVDCLQNDEGCYEGLPISIQSGAIPLATLRETAGPILRFVDHGNEKPEDGIYLGDYRSGISKVDIEWN